MVDISIVMPAYNAGKTIARALDSILMQSTGAIQYEIVVINDGSNDNTASILAQYGTKLRIINQSNQGYVKAGITGVENAKGKYLVKLDSDDEFLPDALLKLHTALKNNPDIAFAYSDYYEKDAETGKQKIVSTKDNIFNTVAIGIMFRKDVLDELGFYDAALVFPEYDLLIRILKKYKGVHIAEPLFVYYRSKTSMTADKKLVEKGMGQLRRKYGELPVRGY